MKKREKKGVDYAFRNRMASLISVILIGCVFFIYLNSTKARIDSYAYYTLQSQLELTALSIDAKLNDARKSIVAAAGDVASLWKDDPDFDAVAVVNSVKGKYSFDVLEFVDEDGINLMSGSNRFDASDREYYKKGILGLSGLWINYNPRESKEFLLDFYSPVYSNGKIKGVLVGAIGSRYTLEPLTKTSYLGRDSIGVLFNEDGRVISASFGATQELYPDDLYEMFNVTKSDRAVFDAHVASKDKSVFSYEGPKGRGIACVGSVPRYGWGLIIIIPSSSFSDVYSDFTSTGILTLGCVIIIVYIYIFYILRINKYLYTSRLKQDEDIIKGFSKVYHTVFMLDYDEGTARCLRTRDPVAAKYDIKEGETVAISGVLIQYILDGSDLGSKEIISSLDNVMYIKTMMSGREFFSMRYGRAIGGSGTIDIADMGYGEENGDDKPGDGENKSRNCYLLGLVSVD